MIGEEKVDKAPNTTSEISTEKTDEESTGISNKTSDASTETSKKFICEECSKPFETKRQLIGHMRVHSKKSYTAEEDVIDEFLDERETLDRIIAEATPTKKRKAIVRMASRHLGNKRESIETLAEALRLADVDPHLRNLIVKNWASHIDVPDIEDVLDLEKKEEKKKEGEKKEGEKKIEEDEGKEKKKTRNIEDVLKKGQDRRLTRLDSLQIQKEIVDLEKEMGVGKEEEKKEEEKKHTLIVDGVSLKLTAEEMLSWKRYLLEEKKEEELKEERKEERRQQAAERQRLIDERPSPNDGGLVEWVVGEGDNTRIIKVRPETIPLLVQAQGSKTPQNPSGPSREEVEHMVERTIEAQTKKLTTDDVERIVQRVMGGYQPGALTKHDLLYLEAKDKLRLEEKKLDETGRTRDVIANGIRDGFGHAGRIVSRMMTEEGGGTGMPVEGYSDQAGNMMKVACPKTLGGCGAMITAPIGSPTVVCPGCGRRWTVEPQEPAKQKIEPKTPAPKSVPESTTAATPETPKQTTDASKDISEPTTIDVPKDVEKIAENIAIGEGAKKLEEELKKKKELEELRQRHEEENERKRESALKKVKESVEKKPWPTIDSNICPICHKKYKGKRGVGMHITVVHPEYKK